MSAAFTVGEVVDITIRGARVTNSYPTSRDGMDTGLVVVAKVVGPDDPLGRNIAVNVMTPGVTVERVAPVEWPPQPGDLWRDRSGGLWFTADVRDVCETDVPEIVMVYAHDDWRQKPDAVNQHSGPLTLVHREQPAEANGGES